MEISNFLDKEFNVLVIKVLSKLGRRLDEESENFDREKI